MCHIFYIGLFMFSQCYEIKCVHYKYKRHQVCMNYGRYSHKKVNLSL